MPKFADLKVLYKANWLDLFFLDYDFQHPDRYPVDFFCYWPDQNETTSQGQFALQLYAIVCVVLLLV